MSTEHIKNQGEIAPSPTDAPLLAPDAIMKLGFSVWPSKVLLTAVELDLFTKLAAAPGGAMTNAQIVQACHLHDEEQRVVVADFTDCLVALRLLERQDKAGCVGEESLYSHSLVAQEFLDKKSTTYIGHDMLHAATILYPSCVLYAQHVRHASVETTNQELIAAMDEWIKNSKATNTTETLDALPLLDLAYSFWPSRVLVAAVELDLFSILSTHQEKIGDGCDLVEIRQLLSLKASDGAVSQFLRVLAECQMLEKRNPTNETTRDVYVCTPQTAQFLDRNKSTYIGGILVLLSQRQFRIWGNFKEALETGGAQNESKSGGDPFAELYRDPQRLETFLEGMMGFSAGNFIALAQKFDFAPYKSLVDIGGATGQLESLVFPTST
jgi:Dimerisation domain